jgi:hypothetical protein
MASVTPTVRSLHRHKQSFPFDTVGAIALAWSAAFLTLAFLLGEALR